MRQPKGYLVYSEHCTLAGEVKGTTDEYPEIAEKLGSMYENSDFFTLTLEQAQARKQAVLDGKFGTGSYAGFVLRSAENVIKYAEGVR